MSSENPKISILVVDDGPENLLVMKAILRREEYEIVEASSGLEAIKLFAEREFAVVLLDIQMPVMDGHETALRLRSMKNGHATPIIFVTAGMDDKHHILTGYESGAVDYLLKPVDPPILRSKVKIFAELYLAKLEIRKQARLLREIDENNRNSFLENALDAVIGMNETGEINYWNNQAVKIFGWSKEEVMGQQLSELIVPSELRKDFHLSLAKFLKERQSSLLNERFDAFALRKNGVEFPVEISVTPIMINDRYSFSAFIRDISQRKLEQLNLQKAIQARDEFIGICSHELKTPLTALKLQYQMAERMYHQGEDRIFQRADIIKRIDATNMQLRRMSKLVENMLDVTKMSSSEITLNKEEVSFSLLIKNALENYKDQLKESNIKINLVNEASFDLVYVDSFRIEQAISNLISNAIKYGRGRPIELKLKVEERMCIFSVLDQGLGIEHKDLERIFERYERAITRTEVSGLGLGLYIGQKIIKAHQGELRVASRPGEGSIFSIVLPLLEKGAELSH